LHLRDGSGHGANNVGETDNELGEWALADDDQRTINDSDALSWSLESLRLLGEHLDIGDDLSWRERSEGRHGGHGSDENLAERNHFDDECGGKEVVI
jgi:hypothetical protein